MFRSFFSSRGTPAAEGDSEKDVQPERENAAKITGAGIAAERQENKAVANRIQKMDSIIRRKLHSTGAQYNMKVVIRGERGVGKSTLLRRLQGLPYEEQYIPTPEIQTTTINNWGYRGSQDVVKVEVWDVVDKGLATGSVSRVADDGDLEDTVAGLPPDSGPASGGRALAVLDASVVNVYQGANAVIFMVDPYRPETLDKVERALAEAPVDIPAVILLNFRDKLEEDEAAKASERSQVAAVSPPVSGERPSPDDTESLSTKEEASPSASGDGVAAADGDVRAVGVEAAEGGAEVGTTEAASTDKQQQEQAAAAAERESAPWGHVATLETARLMMDRAREADMAEGRGSGRRISLFDCSMKNCFGLRVLYTYLNVPFLELKRQSLLRQAQIAAETLDKEYRELEGFIDGHSYANYMQHLQSSDVDPTAGRSAPANPPGRPSISSLPTPSSLGESSLERRGSTDSHVKKEKKKKHNKDKERDKSKKKERHRHKGSKSGRELRETTQYEGKVTDAKEFTPATKKTVTEELDDFFGASSDGGSDVGARGRSKVVKAIDAAALANSTAHGPGTDSDEMPARVGSRLKRVTAPVKPGPGFRATARPVMPAVGGESSQEAARMRGEKAPAMASRPAAVLTRDVDDVRSGETHLNDPTRCEGGRTTTIDRRHTPDPSTEEGSRSPHPVEFRDEDARVSVEPPSEAQPQVATPEDNAPVADTCDGSVHTGRVSDDSLGSRSDAPPTVDSVGYAQDSADDDRVKRLENHESAEAGRVPTRGESIDGNGDRGDVAGDDGPAGARVDKTGATIPGATAAHALARDDLVGGSDSGLEDEIPANGKEAVDATEMFFAGGESSEEDSGTLGIAAAHAEADDDGDNSFRESSDEASKAAATNGTQPPSPRLIASSMSRATAHSRSPVAVSRKSIASAGGEELSAGAKAAIATALASASTGQPASTSPVRPQEDGKLRKKRKSGKQRRRKGSQSGDDDSVVGTVSDKHAERRSGADGSSSRRHHRRTRKDEQLY